MDDRCREVLVWMVEIWLVDCLFGFISILSRFYFDFISILLPFYLDFISILPRFFVPNFVLTLILILILHQFK